MYVIIIIKNGMVFPVLYPQSIRSMLFVSIQHAKKYLSQPRYLNTIYEIYDVKHFENRKPKDVPWIPGGKY